MQEKCTCRGKIMIYECQIVTIPSTLGLWEHAGERTVWFCVLASDFLSTPVSIEGNIACFRYVWPARLFQDSEPEVRKQPPRKRLALDSAKNNCYTAVLDGETLNCSWVLRRRWWRRSNYSLCCQGCAYGFLNINYHYKILCLTYFQRIWIYRVSQLLIYSLCS